MQKSFRKSKILLVLFSVILTLTACNSFNIRKEIKLLIKAGKLYDSQNGLFLNNYQILIENDKIIAVGENISIEENVKVLDLSDCTVTPGLIDGHTHFLTQKKFGENLAIDASKPDEERIMRGLAIAESYLMEGFTSIKDLGNCGQYLDVMLRDSINTGRYSGPNMYVSGPAISAEGGQFSEIPVGYDKSIIEKEYCVIRNPHDIEYAIEQHIKHKVNLIKIIADGDQKELSSENMKLICDLSHKKNLKVTAHATHDKIIRKAVEAGVDGIEHGYYVSDSTLTLMAEKGVFLVATGITAGALIKSYQIQKKDHLPKDTLVVLLGYLKDRLRRAYSKDVLIVSGADVFTDYGVPQGIMAKDVLISYFENGFTPAELLQFATYNAAKSMDMEDRIGRLAPGYIADIAVFKGDLEKDFQRILYKSIMTIKNGKLFKHSVQ